MRPIAIIVAAIIGVCFFGLVLVAGVLMSSRPSPDVAARRYNEAIQAKDLAIARDLTCRDRQDIYANPGAFAAISRELIDVRYDTISVDGDTARVREAGKVKSTVLGASLTDNVNNVIVMRREDGQWRVCPPRN